MAQWFHCKPSSFTKETDRQRENQEKVRERGKRENSKENFKKDKVIPHINGFHFHSPDQEKEHLGLLLPRKPFKEWGILRDFRGGGKFLLPKMCSAHFCSQHNLPAWLCNYFWVALKSFGPVSPFVCIEDQPAQGNRQPVVWCGLPERTDASSEFFHALMFYTSGSQSVVLWELVWKSNSQIPPRPTTSEILGVGPRNLCHNKPSRWF